ncbi:glutathione S-transferase family protein [Pseudoalteromonas sp. B137]
MKLYYFAFSTPALATLMVAEAIGAPYQKQYIDLRKGEQRDPDYLALNPMGKVPTMVDDDLVLTESVAIQIYMARKSKTDLYPRDLPDQAVVNRWLNLAVHEVRTPVLDIEVYRWIAQQLGNPVNEGLVEVAMSRLERSLPVLNSQLTNSNFLNGSNLTIADISLISALDPVDTVGIDISDYPALRSQLDWGRKQDWYQAVNTHFGAEAGL